MKKKRRDEIHWHGWGTERIPRFRRVTEELYIGYLPGRKSPALYFGEPNEARLTPVAYFKSEEDAKRTMDFIDQLARAK